MDQGRRDVVLVVDDAVDTIRMLSDVLEDAAITVLVALDGSQALTIARSIVPDAILLDALMPNMDGFETCRRLKQNPELADVPVLFMTGLSDTEHVVMGLRAGGVDYLTKPVNPDEMLARIQVHIANARMTHSARMALDSAGQALFAVDKHGAVVWATPQVQKRLSGTGGAEGSAPLRLQDALAQWLAHDLQNGHTLTPETASEGVTIEYVAMLEGQHLLRLCHTPRPNEAPDALRREFALTAREAEVMLWIANGKTNREIGQILDMSPRTVNKHLEQVFRKLGVENRTTAAAMAIRYLARIA